MSFTEAPVRSGEYDVIVEVAPPRDAQRRALARAAVVRHPALAEITSITETDRGLRVTYALPSDARPLAPGVALTADDVVRLLAPVAAGISQLHDAECVHGAVSIGSVYARTDGAGVLAPGSGSGAVADDVHDVVAILRDLLPSQSVGADLAHLIVIGTDPDASVRPSMARVAAILDLARRRLAPPTSPPAQRRAGTCPEPLRPVGSAQPPLSGWPVGSAQPPLSGGSPLPPGSAKVSRARHAAPAGRSRRDAPRQRSRLSDLRLPWRVMGAVAALAVAGALVLGAMRPPEAPLVCPAAPAATSPTPPAESPDRSSDRSS